MKSKWREYWLAHDAAIRRALSEWRESRHARVPLLGLRELSKRKDLYSCTTVTTHGPAPNVGGKRHMLELGLFVAGLLKAGETLDLRIVRDNGDHLDLS